MVIMFINLQIFVSAFRISFGAHFPKFNSQSMALIELWRFF